MARTDATGTVRDVVPLRSGGLGNTPENDLVVRNVYEWDAAADVGCHVFLDTKKDRWEFCRIEVPA